MKKTISLAIIAAEMLLLTDCEHRHSLTADE